MEQNVWFQGGICPEESLRRFKAIINFIYCQIDRPLLLNKMCGFKEAYSLKNVQLGQIVAGL